MTLLISSSDAMKQARTGRSARNFPAKDDARFSNRMLFPHLKPSFELHTGNMVFTIGSCFARNIETRLDGFVLPTRSVDLPAVDIKARHGNGILNEFTPGSIAQRIRWALGAQDTTSLKAGYAGDEEKSYDTLFPKGKRRPLARLKEIRGLVDGVYANLARSDAMIVTLGMAETWYDKDNEIWLNRMPEIAELQAEPNRFQFRIMSVDDSFMLLSEAFGGLIDGGMKKIILTVSPVPLQTTFSGTDCVTANSYSKSVMRVCAEQLRMRFVGVVDYFPSYEMVLSGGPAAFQQDFVHPKEDVISRVTEYMVRHYVV
ncbi:GSCFA domain-containing protein [Sedimentitalea sp.]|uniref:GSCFA domain-containing protein n=1 Tax=Sedimentitalea sp. TaxID=2048915 RepID=UPI0032988170